MAYRLVLSFLALLPVVLAIPAAPIESVASLPSKARHHIGIPFGTTGALTAAYPTGTAAVPLIATENMNGTLDYLNPMGFNLTDAEFCRLSNLTQQVEKWLYILNNPPQPRASSRPLATGIHNTHIPHPTSYNSAGGAFPTLSPHSGGSKNRTNALKAYLTASDELLDQAVDIEMSLYMLDKKKAAGGILRFEAKCKNGTSVNGTYEAPGPRMGTGPRPMKLV
ncbi:hypothetical protein MMC12_004977 [Toensbergia leucococca]|nr:hypothetical protein [Toensbergia leucococca]